MTRIAKTDPRKKTARPAKQKGTRSGAALVALMRASPLRDTHFASPRVLCPVRDVRL